MILDRFGKPIKIERKGLSAEMATFGLATGARLEVMPDPDPILKKRGDDATVLAALAADDQVTMAMQLRKRKITNKRNYDFSPGQPEKGESPSRAATELCHSLTRDLAQIALRAVFSASLEAVFYGYTVFELFWAVEGSRMRLADVQEKPREWFGFDGNGQLFFLANGERKKTPWGKFLVVQHEPTYANPYGLRLLSRCLWPVAFKNGGVQWAVNFLERYGTPWQVARAPQDYDHRMRQDLARQLAGMVQDAVAVLPHGAEHELIAANSKNGAEGYLAFLNFWNATISKVLSCQTQSSEITGSGTYASSKTHYEVLEDVVQADEMLVCDAMNNLAVIYAGVNGSAEYPPVFAFNEAEDHLAQAELDKRRFDIGVRFTKAHFERLGLDQNEFEIAPLLNQPNSQKVSEHAAHGSLPEPWYRPFDLLAGRKSNVSEHEKQNDALEGLHQDMLDDFAGKTATNIDIKAAEDAVMTAIMSSESYEEAMVKVLELYPDLPGGNLEEMLHQGLFAAELFGRWSVAEEADDD